MLQPTATVEAARAALARGAWADARAELEHAVARAPDDAVAWETLGTAATWQQDIDRALEARQRAYTLYRARADDLAAGRVCLDLANDYFEVRGELAVGNGWFQRGRRLLEAQPEAREHALLRVWDAYFALLGDADPAAAELHARAAVAISERVGAVDTAVVGRALEGLARVTGGEVREGMALLDEAVAAALGGELDEPQTFFLACCCMIDACDRVRDYGRALEWCDHLAEFSQRWRVQAFLTTCRLKYSSVLLWRGDWPATERHLERAMEELSAARSAAVSGALVRLAELRRRQGRRGEATSILERVRSHPLALPVRAALAFDAGDAATAVDLLNVVLRRVPPQARTERVAALELKARAHTALGEQAAANELVAELEETAAILATPPLRATALAARARVDADAGEHDRARHGFEDAASLFEASGSPYEAARTRLELAASLARLGRHDAALAEAQAALAVLEPLGAATAARRARALLRGLEPRVARGGERARRGAGRAPLTKRQRQVLSLVADGLGDREIAERLSLSEYTVHRHVANILTRLDVSTRTAAVARALRSGLL